MYRLLLVVPGLPNTHTKGHKCQLSCDLRGGQGEGIGRSSCSGWVTGIWRKRRFRTCAAAQVRPGKTLAPARSSTKAACGLEQPSCQDAGCRCFSNQASSTGQPERCSCPPGSAGTAGISRPGRRTGRFIPMAGLRQGGALAEFGGSAKVACEREQRICHHACGHCAGSARTVGGTASRIEARHLGVCRPPGRLPDRRSRDKTRRQSACVFCEVPALPAPLQLEGSAHWRRVPKGYLQHQSSDETHGQDLVEKTRRASCRNQLLVGGVPAWGGFPSGYRQLEAE